jgi:putative membrane protein
MALAAWIGGYVLFLLVRPLSRRAMAANQSPLRVAVAGWLTPALVGVAQVAAMLAVVAIAVRIVPENLPGTLLFLVLMSATFVAIIHALNAWFGPAGQFLGLVLMVLQLVTAGGTFPWQTIPQPLHWLHHLLPMSYAIDGLRQLMYGGLSTLVLRDAAVLLVWFAVAMFASTRAARVQRIWTVQRVKPEVAI